MFTKCSFYPYPTKVSILTLFVLSLGLFSCNSATEEVKETETEGIVEADAEPGLMHTVYFWLNEDVDEASAENFERGVWKLEAIPSVKRMFFGPAAGTPSRDVVDNTFDYALIVWFDDVAGHDEYQEHPIHLEFVEQQGAKFGKVQVHDNVLME